MVANKASDRAGPKPAAPKNEDRPVFSDTASRQPTSDHRSGGGKKGPPSALEGGQGSEREARYGKAKAQSYSVQVHSDEDVGGLKRGLQVLYVDAESGDEAALKVRNAHKGNFGLSIRGVTPASDPDANSMGGERDAAIMIANAENGGDAGMNPRGTKANAEAVEKLGKADIEDLGE